MLKKVFLSLAAIFCVVGMLFIGCSNEISSEKNLSFLLSQNANVNDSNLEYGTIEIVTGSDSRALDVSTITSATVTVSGYGMDDVQGTNVNLSNGAGTATISNIPVGSNRVVTVKSNIDGAVIRGVCNVVSGDNNQCEVNWDSTAVANVFYCLIKANADVSSIESSSFSSKIPSVHASLFNAEQFAADFKAASFSATGLNSTAYVLGYGNVVVNYTNANGYTVQVTDIASEKTTFTTASGNTTLKGYPGEWKVKVFDETGALKETKDVVIAANKDTKITVKHVSGGTPVTGKIIVHVPSSLGYTCIWAWATSGSTNYTGGNWPGKTMTLNGSYYDYTIEQTACKVIFNDNNKGNTVGTNQTNNLWVTEGEWNYIGGKSGTSDTSGSKISSNFEPATVEESLTVTVENPQVPVAPTATITPDSDTISVSGTITVKLTNGNDVISAASVTVSGAASKTYTYSNFTNDVLTINVSDLGITEADKTITVNASVTNSVKTVTATPKTYKTTPNVVVADTFTWDNANVYFVIQDRFCDGDFSNNNSYGRMTQDDLGKKIGTFHGGDIKGLTQKLDYIEDLGINAIWITAAYEQAHGWCGGGDDGDFAHYGYHGYYPLDYTMIDKNMGTVEEFRTFVTECHKRGIRVVMDVVMNHTGYLSLQDCQEYSINIFKGSYSGGKSTDMGFRIGSDGSTYHAHHDKIDYIGHDDGWAKWWGSSWVRAGVPGYSAGGRDDLTMNLNNLPDVRTNNTTAQKAAPILQTKWSKETSGYDNWIIPAAKNLRSTSASNAPVVWIEKWLAAWVEEFGIDGFRCDTAKHVDYYRWGELKGLCKTALNTWRTSDRADQYAKNWDEEFWMTGEAFGHNGGQDFSSLYNNGFNNLIDFKVGYKEKMHEYDPLNNGDHSLPDWNSRSGVKNLLLYVSSHDTGLGRSGSQEELGTKLVLMPGPVQIFYGDESKRREGECGSDQNQGTRSDMNWSSGSITYSSSMTVQNASCVRHWGKLGTFRKFNPAVGAGSISGNTRTYGDNKVVISTSSKTVSVPYSNGTTVYNWYDGKSATVQNGSVTFSGSSASTTAPVLCSDRNPADYGVTF